MSRALRTLMVFLLSMFLFGHLLSISGVAATLGLSTELGAGDEADDVINKAEQGVPTGSSTGDTLFGMYNVLGGFIGDIFAFINPGLAMLENAGVPSVIMKQFLIPLVTVIKTIGMAYFLRGLS